MPTFRFRSPFKALPVLTLAVALFCFPSFLNAGSLIAEKGSFDMVRLFASAGRSQQVPGFLVEHVSSETLAPSISVTKTPRVGPFQVPETTICNDRSMTMRYVVTNTGDQVLNNINVDDTDAGIGHVAGPFSLNPGQSATFDVPRTINGTVSGTVTAAGTSAGTGDLVSSMASLTVNGVVCGITVTKSVNFPNICNPQEVEWTVTIQNNSSVFTWEGRLDDTRFGQLDPTPPLTLFHLNPGEKRTYVRTGFLNFPDFTNGQYTNTATGIGETGNDATPANDSASATVRLVDCDNSIGGLKFFDVNANGVQDPGDNPIQGFTIRTTFTPELSAPNTNDVLRVTGADGTWSILGIPTGTRYLVQEDLPATACNASSQPLFGYYWIQTAPDFITVPGPGDTELSIRAYSGTVNEENVTGLDFGNRCQRNGFGGRTIGGWSNKNGLALITASDAAQLNAYYLRIQSGAHAPTFAHPASFKDKGAFSNWLLGANATNMAYMLSAQMAATYLNSTHGVDPNALLDVNGQIGTIAQWLADADASLAAHPLTLDGHAERANQERLKNIFDRINNNNYFIINTGCRVCAAAE